MVVQLDPHPRVSIFPFGKWRQPHRRAQEHHESGAEIDVGSICAALRRARSGLEAKEGHEVALGRLPLAIAPPASTSERRSTMTQPGLSPPPPRSKSETNLRATVSSPLTPSPARPLLSRSPSTPSLLTTPLSTIPFVPFPLPQPLTTLNLPYRLPKPPSPPPKRTRPLSDTDGPLTSSLPSKKRRLRRHLITSRLSQPFSQPATHILNRDGPQSDKRFTKLATLINAGRLHHPPPTLRRIAMRNRLRLRVEDESRARGDGRVPVVAWNVVMGVRTGEGFGGFRGEARRVLSPPGSPEGVKPRRVGDGLRESGKREWLLPGARVPLPPSTLSPARRRTPEPEVEMPRPPGRPVLAPTVPPVVEEEEEDDGCAFPGSGMWESALDGGDVYSDFGLMFGGGSGSDGEGDGESDEVEENYEDYMDELDGIPFNAR